MTQPTQPQTVTVKTGGGKSLLLPWILVLTTVTLGAVRWTGYAALPLLVVFAPLLTFVGIIALATVLLVIGAIISALLGGKDA